MACKHRSKASKKHIADDCRRGGIRRNHGSTEYHGAFIMRILVCGGRNFGRVVRTKPTIAAESSETLARLEEYKFIQDELNKLMIKLSANYDPNDNWLPTDIVIIEGGATGTDNAAADFATNNFCKLEVFPADWKQHGRSAGYIRNKQMLFEGKPDLVVAFPGGKGTAMMVDLANRAGIKAIEMGTLGFSSQISPQADLLDDVVTFKTKRFQDIYIDRLEKSLGEAKYAKNIILREVLQLEREWLDNMGSEYDEIMQAQEIM